MGGQKGVSDELVQWFAAICRDSGLRVTPQRIEIFREILSARDHPTAEQLHARLRERVPMLSLDTVYRTLSTLEHFGVIIRMHQPETSARYDAMLRRHHHFICRICGKIVDLPETTVAKDLLSSDMAEVGLVELCHVQLRGVCGACLGAAKKAKTDGRGAAREREVMT